MAEIRRVEFLVDDREFVCCEGARDPVSDPLERGDFASKFEVLAGGTELTDLSAVSGLTAAKVTCDSGPRSTRSS